VAATAGAASPVSTAVSAAEKSPRLPAGQVWECNSNGQRTFSSSPCGPGASIRQLNAINTMEASPLLPYTSSYDDGQGYSSGYYDNGGPGTDNRPLVVVRRNPYPGARHEHPPPRNRARASANFRP